jgi:carbon monoxide dehydrogenase subunit G
MKISGEQSIAAPPDAVWRALNDPEVLRRSIPGCKTLDKASGNAFRATVETKIGPINATFNGDVELSDLDPPHGYTLSGRGSAGGMGNAKGVAKVRLAPAGGGTKLTYDVDAEVTGKFAQLGSRLIQSTAGILARQFFDRFTEVVAGPSAEPKAPTHLTRRLLSWWIWAVAALAFAALIYFLLRGH